MFKFILTLFNFWIETNANCMQRGGGNTGNPKRMDIFFLGDIALVNELNTFIEIFTNIKFSRVISSLFFFQQLLFVGGGSEMIQRYSTSGSRKSGGVINKRKSCGSLDKKSTRALVKHKKCRLPQCTPKDWPEPSKFFAYFRKFKELF